MKVAVTGVDFETESIEGRPAYPPVPVGVSIKRPTDRASHYYAWGHPTGNNCTKAEAQRALAAVWKTDNLVFHHSKFDVDVAQVHMGMPELPWQRCHDTAFILFLMDPHAFSFQLKPAAAKHLGMPPEEQEAVRNWLIKEKIVLPKDSKWGAHIAKAPGGLVGKYANGDVIRTVKLFDKLYPALVKEGMSEAYDRERKLMPIFLASERIGMRIDTAALKRDIAVYQKANIIVEKWLAKKFKVPYGEFNFDSDAAVGSCLDELGIVTEWTLTKTGKKSVAKKNMTVDKFRDKKVFYALGYRNRLQTCLRMFMEPWLVMAENNNGYIQPTWNQIRQTKSGDDNKGTRTGRPSCDNPNLLNLSKEFVNRGDGYEHPTFIKELPELPLVRKYALPDKGTVWAHRDYNQQELRILAHFEDGAILEAYRANPDLDVHTFVQSEIKRLMQRDVDRVSVKTMNFGKLYGQGLGALAEKLNVSVNEVKSIRDAQDKALPGLKELEKQIKEMAAHDQPIVTWGGRLYYCEPDKYVEKFKRVMSFDYKLINYLIQGSAADATKEAIIRFCTHKKRKPAWRFIVTVYDEINICAPKSELKEAMALLRECMEGLQFDVPMITDGKVGPSWGDLTKYKEKK